MQQNDVMTRNDFYRKLERLVNAPANSIAGTQELTALKNWDSLTILEFIVLADTDYSMDVQAGDITSCKTVDDLAELTLPRTVQ